MNNILYNEPNLETMKRMADNSIDSIVTDPPYGISFMSKHWDYSIPDVATFAECLRVLKPGGYLLCFCGTRTQHRMAVNIEDAGFELRDIIAWVYGSGFPKSLNISKALDKMAGVEREIILKRQHPTLIDKSRIDRQGRLPNHGSNDFADEWNISAPATEAAKQWDGWGTALKPAMELITMARKPLSEKTVAANVLKHGTGGINVDGCRIATNPEVDDKRLGGNGQWQTDKGLVKNVYNGGYVGTPVVSSEHGRFPANLIHDGSEEVVGMFPNSKSGAMTKSYEYQNNGFSMGAPTGSTKHLCEASEGSAARFFYAAKASTAERNEGCDKIEHGCFHPTVKPISLMKYLVKLVTPPGGTVYDPFTGSGSTLIAAKHLGFNYIGSEIQADYVQIAEARLASIKNDQLSLF